MYMYLGLKNNPYCSICICTVVYVTICYVPLFLNSCFQDAASSRACFEIASFLVENWHGFSFHTGLLFFFCKTP